MILSRLLDRAQQHPRRAAAVAIGSLTALGLAGVLLVPRDPPRAATITPAQLVEQRQRAAVVYVTRTGEKFHTERCDHLRASKFETSLYDALKRGYEPCSVCGARRVLRKSTEGD